VDGGPVRAVVKDGYLTAVARSIDKSRTPRTWKVFLMLHRMQNCQGPDVILLAEAAKEGTTQVGIDFM